MERSVSAEDYPKPASSFALLEAKPVSPVLVIIDELNSSLFERCLDPDQCRNIACDCLTAFFYSSPHPEGLSNVSTTMAPIRIRHKEGFHDQRIGTTSSAVLRLVGNICCNDGGIERRPELGPRIR
jgi:hypothetical protein